MTNLLQSILGHKPGRAAPQAITMSEKDRLEWLKTHAISAAEDWVKQLAENPSWEKIESGIRDQVRASVPRDPMADEWDNWPWVIATFDKTAVYSFGGKYYEVDWSLDENKNVILGAGSREVKESVSYTPVATPELDEGKTKAGERKLNEFVWCSATCSTELTEGKPIQIMRPGSFTHPEYGDFDITLADMEEIATNFNNNVRKQEIPVDIDHIHEGGAVGWFKEVKVEDDKLMAVVDWTEEGEDDLSSGKFKYFSPHFGPWQDPETKEDFGIVLLSGAITNFPFLKEMDPIQLSEVVMSRADPEKLPNTEPPNPDPAPPAPDPKPGDPDPTPAQVPTAQLTETQRELSELRKQLSERDNAIKTLSEQVGTMAKGAMVKRLTDIVHGGGETGRRFIGDETEHVEFLTELAEKFGEDSKQVTHYITDQQAHAEQMAKSALFGENGTSGGGSAGSALGQFNTEVTKFLSEHPDKSRADAIGAVATAKPQLYNAYNEEQNRKN